MNYNYEVFSTILKQITEHPETFDMQKWCGTAQCIAGWACAMFDPNYQQAMFDEVYPGLPSGLHYFIPKAMEILNLQQGEDEIFTTQDNDSIVQILNILVSQKNLPTSQQQSLFEIAEHCQIDIGLPF